MLPSNIQEHTRKHAPPNDWIQTLHSTFYEFHLPPALGLFQNWNLMLSKIQVSLAPKIAGVTKALKFTTMCGASPSTVALCLKRISQSDNKR